MPRKLCLLANTFDMTNLLNRVSSQIAAELEMRDTPQGEFVNLYLNGRYNGLYYLAQRPRTGGCVHIDSLDDEIRKANGVQDFNNLPKIRTLNEEGDKLKKWAYDWPNEPADNSGGYLLQQYSNYEGDEPWFSTEYRRFRIMSPSYPTVGQVEYLFTATMERIRTLAGIIRRSWIRIPGRICSVWRSTLSSGTEKDGAFIS